MTDNKLKLCKSCNCMTNTMVGFVYLCGKCGKDRRGAKRQKNENETKSE